LEPSRRHPRVADDIVAIQRSALCWILGRPLFEHCDDDLRTLLSIFQGSHRNFADAAGMVDADLRHSAIEIAAREADFPDRIPCNAATVPKGNTHFGLEASSGFEAKAPPFQGRA